MLVGTNDGLAPEKTAADIKEMVELVKHLKAGLCPDNDKLHLKGWGYELWWNAVSPLLKELCK